MRRAASFMVERGNELRGRRKAGAFDIVDGDDYVLEELPVIRKDRTMDTIDNRSWHRMSQGATTKCTLFTAARVAMGCVSLYHQEFVTFDPDEIMANMGSEYVEGEGAYLRDAFKAVVKYGLHDEHGRLWKFEAFILIPEQQFDEALQKGFSIGTGSYCKSPMCDDDWFWRDATLSDGRGHAWVIYGKGLWEKIKSVFFGDNSWGKYGVQKHGKSTGGFYVKRESIGKLFQSFTLIEPRLI